MPEIDNLVPAPFPLPDPALRRGNLWITQNGRDFSISATRLGYVFQGPKPPVDPFENQTWWDTSVTPAQLKVWQDNRWVNCWTRPVPPNTTYREHLMPNFTLVPFTSSGFFTVTTLNLPAGDWDIWGFVEFMFPTGRTGREMQARITAIAPPDLSLETPFSYESLDIIPDTAPPTMNTFSLALPFHRRFLTPDRTTLYLLGHIQDNSGGIDGDLYKGFLAARGYGDGA